VGTFQTDAFNYDNKWGLVSLNEGRKFLADYDESLDEDQYVTGVALNFKDPYSVTELTHKEANFKDLSFLNWQMANKSLLFALKLEKFTMGSILMLIVVVASFSISGTMMMTVYHRRSQVSLLRSLGMTRKDIAKLFLAHGCSIGAVGIILGLLFGVGICFLLDQLQFLDMPGQAYYLKKVPVKYLPNNYVVIAGLAWLLSIVASAYPAITASRQNPVTGLKI
jgi:lipoprotein-releasing system permease protein